MQFILQTKIQLCIVHFTEQPEICLVERLQDGNGRFKAGLSNSNRGKREKI